MQAANVAATLSKARAEAAAAMAAAVRARAAGVNAEAAAARRAAEEDSAAKRRAAEQAALASALAQGATLVSDTHSPGTWTRPDIQLFLGESLYPLSGPFMFLLVVCGHRCQQCVMPHALDL